MKNMACDCEKKEHTTTFPLDLRTRIVDAVDRDVGTISEIATLFLIHESFIYKLLRQRRGRGDIAPA